VKLNADHRNIRLLSPDEFASNRWGAGDDHLAPDGRVMEMLSEHTCQGWIEGYLLNGQHGFFSCYEAFIHLIDSMFNQHAKWLKVSSKEIAWRPVASLNYLLTSHVWRQDHNGFSRQEPGFIEHVVNNLKLRVVNVVDLIYRLTYRRTNHPNLHVRGYKEEGTTSTPFELISGCTAQLTSHRADRSAA
jgi:phosphoketolase